MVKAARSGLSRDGTPVTAPHNASTKAVDALDNDRPRWIVGQRHDPLDAQEIGT